jgi:PIN domain nuclease of toxin-antitoxin system
VIVGVADTHAVLWYIFSDKRLSTIAHTFMDTAAINGHQIGLSAVTMIEIVYLIEKGKIAAESFSRVAAALDDPLTAFIEIPLDLRVARSLARVNALQIPDMPDRIIAATALHMNVPVVSRDGKIQLSDMKTIW